jgi:tRNA pseudouridine32 synthase/23S rRNA pseudouridine746 synthase
MAEDAQFFRMREVVLPEQKEPLEINSKTWIDCVELLKPEENCFVSKGSHSKALARYALKPITGQRHQLRVHMNALGLPILNDQFYPKVILGAEETDTFDAPLKLLAKSIQFTDPVTGQDRFFTSARQLTTLQ